MFTYQVECPYCEKKQPYHLLTREYDHQRCISCGGTYGVNIQTPFAIVMLLLFGLFQLLYSTFLGDILSVGWAFILGVAFVFVMSVLIVKIISSFVSPNIFFRTYRSSNKQGRKVR